MDYKLFLDDVRTVDMIYPKAEKSEFVIVRTYHEFIDIIKKKGLPTYISFDNDLGCDEKGKLLPEGYDAAKWLVYQSGLDLSKLDFYVHSSNPVAKIQIESLLKNYIKYQKKQKGIKL